MSRVLNSLLSRAHRRWMSVSGIGRQSLFSRKKVTIQKLQAQKLSNTPITMITAYDYPSALACSSDLDLDVVLVGDSLAQVCLGYASTTQLTLDEMIHHASAVSRGTKHPLLIADMPFGSYHASIDDAVKNAVKLVQKANVDGVKMEGGEEIVDTVRRLTSVGIPVMAHVGLMPQRRASFSGYRVQGKHADSATRVLKDAMALQEAGAFAVVIEAVPKDLGRYITQKLHVPSIGIGAGPWTDGQVLVWDDLLGTLNNEKPKFVRHFGDLSTPRDAALRQYLEAVHARTFPDEHRESYSMDEEEWNKFLSANN